MIKQCKASTTWVIFHGYVFHQQGVSGKPNLKSPKGFKAVDHGKQEQSTVQEDNKVRIRSSYSPFRCGSFNILN